MPDQMTIAEVNALIYRYRNGDKEAEEILYIRWKDRVKFFVRKNVWYKDIKDAENLVEHILRKLFNWANSHIVTGSDHTVVYNRVRSICKSQGEKDKREIPLEFAPDYSSTDKSGNKDNRQVIDRKNADYDDVNKEPYFYQPNFPPALKNNLYIVLSKCLDYLTKRQKTALDLYIFHGHAHREVGKIMRITGTAAFNHVKHAIDNLRTCFDQKGINYLSDL